MIDYAKITVIAGSGGDGSGSFTHIKGKRRGKADGGDGGRGGDVFLEATLDLNTLEPFRYKKEYKAPDGGNGASRKSKGASGEELVLKVPVGTLVKFTSGPVTTFPPISAPQPLSTKLSLLRRSKAEKGWVRAVGIPSSLATRSEPYFFDLNEEGKKALIARGGEVGRGNSHLRDEYGRRPFRGEKGEEGERVELELELKLIADVGLVGLPNAGKSTLLKALTSAVPKIADYPFTTLEPNLGVLRIESQSEESKSRNDKLYTSDFDFDSLVLADIPGLIEGASEGKGLGDLFLRHIERTKLLVHLIDVSVDQDLWKVYQTIRSELRSYSKELSKKKEIIVLNKIDLLNKKTLDEKIESFKSHRKKVIPISAKSKVNLDTLIAQIIRRLK